MKNACNFASNKQQQTLKTNKMQNVTKIEILTALAIFMGCLMLAGLFTCNIYLVAISEVLAVIIIGFRFLLTSKN
jgi:hypothetical protein